MMDRRLQALTTLFGILAIVIWYMFNHRCAYVTTDLENIAHSFALGETQVELGACLRAVDEYTALAIDDSEKQRLQDDCVRQSRDSFRTKQRQRMAVFLWEYNLQGNSCIRRLLAADDVLAREVAERIFRVSTSP